MQTLICRTSFSCCITRSTLDPVALQDKTAQFLQNLASSSYWQQWTLRESPLQNAAARESLESSSPCYSKSTFASRPANVSCISSFVKPSFSTESPKFDINPVTRRLASRHQDVSTIAYPTHLGTVSGDVTFYDSRMRLYPLIDFLPSFPLPGPPLSRSSLIHSTLAVTEVQKLAIFVRYSQGPIE